MVEYLEFRPVCSLALAQILIVFWAEAFTVEESAHKIDCAYPKHQGALSSTLQNLGGSPTG